VVTIELGSVRRGRLLLHVLRRLEMASELLFPFDNRRLSPRLFRELLGLEHKEARKELRVLMSRYCTNVQYDTNVRGTDVRLQD